MSRKLKAQETLPVLAGDGRTSLGFCQVTKFGRQPGQPTKHIVIRDTGETIVAELWVYRLHSRVVCGNLEMEVAFVDSTHALAVARAALRCDGGAPERVRAIAEAAAAARP